MKWKLIILAFCVYLTGCQTPSELDIWPIVYYEKDEDLQKTHLDLFTSIYSYHSDPEITSHALRPFFVGEFPKNKDFKQMMFFWPFIYFRQKPDDTLVWILPLYYYRDKKNLELGERDFDWFFLPFFAFGGTDTDEGAYLYLAFWGNIKGLLGFDEISATPFPFYTQARDGDYVSKGYFWPFFRFGEGGGKKFSFYAFVYSDYKKEGFFHRKTYMWPFFHYSTEDLHKKHPRTDWMFFPFYGQSTSEVSRSWMALWPFFSYSRHSPNNYVEYNLPWPFFKYQSSDTANEFRIWPFYWDAERRPTEHVVEKDKVVMWPFFWHSYSDYPTYTKDSWYVIPFYWHHWRQGKEPGANPSERLKIWPLYEYRKDEDGSTRSRILSPLWFEDYFPEGIEKAWLPLFTLYENSDGKYGEKDVTFLGPLYSYKKKADSTYHRVLFFSYKNKQLQQDMDMSRFSVLGGLFEYQREGNEKALRFLYLPHWPSWGQNK